MRNLFILVSLTVFDRQATAQSLGLSHCFQRTRKVRSPGSAAKAETGNHCRSENALRPSARLCWHTIRIFRRGDRRPDRSAFGKLQRNRFWTFFEFRSVSRACSTSPTNGRRKICFARSSAIATAMVMHGRISPVCTSRNSLADNDRRGLVGDLTRSRRRRLRIPPPKYVDGAAWTCGGGGASCLRT